MAILFTVIASVVFLTDIVCKQHVEDHMTDGEEKEILGGRIRIKKVHNKGFAMHKAEDSPDTVKWVSVGAGAVLLFYFIWLLTKRGRLIKKKGVSLMLGGAMSNLYDRVLRGYVVDYINVKSKCSKVSKVVFNIGDVCLLLGGILVVLSSLFKKRRR